MIQVKGIRIDVHVYTNDKQTAINEAIETLKIEKSSNDMLEAKIQKLERKHGRIR